MERGRREFLKTAVGLVATLAGCATADVALRDSIEIDSRLPPGDVAGRQTARLFPFNATFAGHLRRIGGDSSGIGSAGIDYAPHPGAERTLISPVAAGVVIGHRDSHDISGMILTIAHGLGWKSEYAHLEARFVGYGNGRVERGDIIAIMGASGTGATRGGTQGPLPHVHLNLVGPAFTRSIEGSWCALLTFITTMPRLTAPVVEGARVAEYRGRRETPLKVYDNRREFGTR